MSKAVLVIGGGGREHALCWKLAQSAQVSQIYCAPGNGGTATEAKTQNIAIAVDDFSALIAFAKDKHVDLTVVGPDNPLADGIVDAFEAEGVPIFGPVQAGARLESSKAFAKTFMLQNQLPTARFGIFDDKTLALTFCRGFDWARVVKVDGLALGKGVYVCDSLAEVDQALTEILTHNKFGASGTQVVIEECLKGPEFSLMVLCDGKTIRPFTSSQDYKRRFEGNKGPNTGGMGAFSPVSGYAAYETLIQDSILTPLQQALLEAPFVFKGVLFLGLMVNLAENKPYILEFNARFGDPETQVLLPRLKNDLYDILLACVEGTLDQHELQWDNDATVGVTLCGEQYPVSGSKGKKISVGPLSEGVQVFQAGSILTENGTIETAGGRVMTVVAKQETHQKARESVYKAIQAIQFDDMAYRQDIASEEGVLCPSV